MYFMRITLIVLGLCSPLACLADDAVYGFVDAQGELFLSNVPDNDRYRRMDTVPAPGGGVRLRFAPDGGVPAAARRQQYNAVVAQVAWQYGIEAALLHAVISVESGYNSRAVSPRGAAGLMQLMPETAKRYGVADIFDPADNVRGGARYLNDLLKQFDNDMSLALAAYNAGEAAVIKYGRRIPPYRETVAYVPKVVSFYEKYRLLM